MIASRKQWGQDATSPPERFFRPRLLASKQCLWPSGCCDISFRVATNMVCDSRMSRRNDAFSRLRAPVSQSVEVRLRQLAWLANTKSQLRQSPGARVTQGRNDPRCNYPALCAKHTREHTWLVMAAKLPDLRSKLNHVFETRPDANTIVRHKANFTGIQNICCNAGIPAPYLPEPCDACPGKGGRIPGPAQHEHPPLEHR